MSSRENILREVLKNQPADRALPIIDIPVSTGLDEWIPILKARVIACNYS